MRPLVMAICLLTAGLAQAQDQKEPREGGILGTGIVGTITHLGSIYVNQQHVVFDPGMLAKTAFGPRPASRLQPGETVAVSATRAGTQWQANEITLYHPAIGPVVRDANGWSVLGTSIDATGAKLLSEDQIETGDWVAVSGLWRGREIVASRIEEVAAQTRATLIGSFKANQTPEFLLGGTIVTGLEIEHVKTGEVLTVQGRPTASGLHATAVKIGLFEEPVAQVIAEGYLSIPDSLGLYTILGSGVVSFTENPAMISKDMFGVFCNILDASSGLHDMSPNSDGNCTSTTEK